VLVGDTCRSQGFASGRQRVLLLEIETEPDCMLAQDPTLTV